MPRAEEDFPPARSPVRACRDFAVAAAAVCAFAATIFHDFWTPEVFLAGHDTFAHDYLMWQWGWARLFEHHALPLWNPWLFGGFPFVGSFAFCPFYPPAWLSVAFPTSLALTLQYALHLAFGALGFYALARALGLPVGLAVAAALLYEAGSHVASLAYPGHLSKSQALAWLPWAMAAATRAGDAARRGDLRRAIGAAVALSVAWAMQLLASHSQVFYATAGLSAAWLVATGVPRPSEAPRKAWFAALPAIAATLAVTAAIGAGLSMAQMLPALETARQSNRAGGLSFGESADGALPPEELVEIVLPSVRGDSTGTIQYAGAELPYVGRWNAPPGAERGERVVSDYVGFWAFALALTGVFLSRRRARWFFFVSFALATAVAVGPATPIFALLHRVAPGFDRFRSPATFMAVSNLSVFVLAALGLEAVSDLWRRADNRERRRLAGGLLLAGMLGAVALSACGWTVQRQVQLADERTIVTNVERLHLCISLRRTATVAAAGCALLAAAAWLLRASQSRGRRRAGYVLLAAFLGLALLDGARNVRRFLPRNPTRGLEQYLQRHWVDTAVLRHAAESTQPMLLNPGRELSNRSMMRDVRLVHGYHPVVLGEYMRLVEAAGGFESPTLASLFACNYLALDAGVDAPAGWTIIAGRDGRKVLARDEPIDFALIPRRVEPLNAKWQDLSVANWSERLCAPDLDPAAEAVCEGGFAWAPAESAHHADLPRVRTTSPRPGVYLLGTEDTAAPPASAAESGDSANLIPCLTPIPAAPGWRAWIRRPDGAFERLADWPRRANGFLLLVPLDRRAGFVTELRYEPLSQRIGTAVSLATLALLAVAVGLGVFTDRRATARGGV